MKETDAMSVAIGMYNDGYNKAIDEVFNKAFDVDMDSSLIYIRFDKEDFDIPFMTRKAELKEWLKEQLKEQNK